MKKNICNCETCSDKGWIETTVYYSHNIKDGTTQIEKCDSCNIFVDDNTARTHVLNFLERNN